MNDVELSIRMTADAREAAEAMDDVGDAAVRMGADVDRGTRDADAASSRLDGVAESSDNVASKGAQAAGALSGLGDLMGGPFGAAMVVGGTAMQAAADAGDLLNVVTESAIVRKVKDTAVTIAHRTATLASAAAAKTTAAAQWALNAAMSANPIAIVVIAALALVAAFVLLYQRSERFRSIIAAVMAAASKAMEGFRAVALAVWKAIKTAGQAVWSAIRAYIRVVVTAIRLYLTAYKLVALAVWKAIRVAAQAVWSAIQAVVRKVVTAIRLYLTAYKTVAVAVWSAIKDAAVRVWGAIKDYVSGRVAAIKQLADTVRTKFVDVWARVKTAGTGAIEAVTKPIRDAIDLVQDLIGWIKDIDFPSPPDWLGKLPGVGRVMTTAPTTATVAAVGAGTTININVTAGVGDPITIAAAVSNVLDRRARYLGGN